MFSAVNILRGLGVDDATANTLGKVEPGQTYVVTDTRENPRKPLTELATFKKFEVEENEPGEAATGVKLVDVDALHVAKHLFQNRAEDYSHDSVKRIIKAVNNGSFDWAAFDAITVWQSPTDGKLYILSGHSRTEAFRQLAKMGKTAQGKGFDKIPVKYFEGSVDEAKEFARNSNTLSTKETDVERAGYYRNLRATGTPEKDIREKAKDSEGSNANRIYAFSFLSPTGKTIAALISLEHGETQSRAQLQSVGSWIGKARATWPQLTNAHENELYDWLVNENGYGTKAGQVSNEREFSDRLSTAINRNTEYGVFKANEPLNILSKQYLTPIELEHRKAINDAENELNEAKKNLEQKRKTLIAAKVTGTDFDRILKPYDDAVTVAQRKVIELKNRTASVSEAARNQTSLFGMHNLYTPESIGAAEIINANGQNLNTKGMRPTYKFLTSYDHLIDKAQNVSTYKGSGGLKDTLQLIKLATAKSVPQVKALAAHLKADSKAQSVFNIWHWMKLNLKYAYDKNGHEEIRTAARTYADRLGTGADCEDFTIFSAALLINMGYQPKARIVGFNGNANYGHIYTIV